MQYRNPQELPGDLVQLMGKQIESLEKEAFVGLTAAERREYEERQHRLDQLCEELRTCTLPHGSLRPHEPRLTRYSHQDQYVGAR
jgi:hypothetical protein